MKSQRYVTLRQLEGAKIRSAEFEGRAHIVVPVVALVEGVLHAMNSPNPELVLAEEFSQAPGGWNGRPVVPDHPIREGQPVSANHPEVLETEGIGVIFNARIENSRLLMDAWIDVERAKAHPKGLALLKRLELGDPLEISVGVFVLTEEGSGVYNGVRYNGIWRSIVPDHLALLSEGSTGACSNEMGCGAPRVAVKNQLTNEAITIIMEPTEREKQRMSLKERLMRSLKSVLGTAEADMGNHELHSRLWDALFSTEPAFSGIDEVFSSSKTVVYATAPKGEYTLYRRSFSVADDGSVTLADDREEVVSVRHYEPVAAADAPSDVPKAASCGCQSHAGKEVKTMSKEQRIAALLASKKNAFTKDVHGAFLESLTDDQLKAIEEAEGKIEEPKPVTEPVAAPVAPVAAPAVAAAPVVEPAKAKTLAEELAGMHPDVRRQVERGLAAEKAQKDAITVRIKANKKNTFTDAQLADKSVEELNQIAAFAGIELVGADETVNFGGRAASREETLNTDKADAPEAPSSTTDQLKAAGRAK